MELFPLDFRLTIRSNTNYMSTMRHTSIATLLLVFTGMCVVGCGESRSGKATLLATPAGAVVNTTQEPMPVPLSTRPLPGPVPSHVASPLPNPVETAQVIATERALAPTVLAAQSATAKAFYELLTTPVLVKDYGSWSFRAFRHRIYDPGPTWNVSVHIKYDTGSVKSLRLYAISNSELAHRMAAEAGGEQVRVLVTFRNYLTVEQFNKWALAMGIHPDYTELRVIYGMDPLYTPIPNDRRTPKFLPGDVLRVVPVAGDVAPLPRARVEEELAKQKKNAFASGYLLRELKGVYFTVATVEAKQLPTITEDPSVFLTDISYDWARHELRVAEVIDIDNIRVYNTSPMPESVFRYMEQFGLDNFTK